MGAVCSLISCPEAASESWGDLADDLRTLADCTFPELQDEAHEKLSLDRYPSQIENPQIVFNIRQQQPKTLDDGIYSTALCMAVT